MFCTKCGQYNADGAKFCYRCGSAIEAPQNPPPQEAGAGEQSVPFGQNVYGQRAPEISAEEIARRKLEESNRKASQLQSTRLGVLQRILKNPLFLITAFAYSFLCLYYLDNTEDASELYRYLGAGDELEQLSWASIISSVTIAVGLWVTFFAGYSAKGFPVKTNGLEAVRIAMVCKLICAVVTTLMCLETVEGLTAYLSDEAEMAAIAMLLILLVSCELFGIGTGLGVLMVLTEAAEAGDGDMTSVILLLLAIGATVVVMIVAVFKALNHAIQAMKTGDFTGDPPVFGAIMLLIYGGCFAYQYLDDMTFELMLAAITPILFGCVMLQYQGTVRQKA